MDWLGSSEARLVIVRGNSGSGKSALALAIRNSLPRGVAVIGQDLLRRNILHVLDKKCSPAADYIGLSARFALERGLHVVIEGIPYDEIYGDMLRNLVSSHRGITRCYRLSIPFSETLRRHQMKPNATEFGEMEMRQWWRDGDRLTGVKEAILGMDYSLTDSVLRVIQDCSRQSAISD